jgi:hypothetical protein
MIQRSKSYALIIDGKRVAYGSKDEMRKLQKQRGGKIAFFATVPNAGDPGPELLAKLFPLTR